jgi:hypothetical protein
VGRRGLLEQIHLACNRLLALLFLCRDPGIQCRPFQAPPARRLGRVAWRRTGGGTGSGCCCRCSWCKSSMARHTRSLPSRHGTLTHTISSLCGGPSDAIGLPPAHMLMMLSSLPFFSRAAHGRRPGMPRLWGTGMGTAVAPKWKNHVKGQACLGCKRNSLLPLTLVQSDESHFLVSPVSRQRRTSGIELL